MKKKYMFLNKWYIYSNYILNLLSKIFKVFNYFYIYLGYIYS